MHSKFPLSHLATTRAVATQLPSGPGQHGGIFSFPVYDAGPEAKFTPLIANLQVHDFIRGVEAFEGENSDSASPTLRARIPVELDDYYHDGFLQNSMVIAFARPWNRSQVSMAEWSRYHTEPDLYGYIIQCPRSGTQGIPH